mmetsp:Transcript_29368/g.53892  ORF Transcript_29368/g.53892 Transcript_29368/m.53892 type:complete len:232 (-) Transcript_29368:945-1640(-)
MTTTTGLKTPPDIPLPTPAPPPPNIPPSPSVAAAKRLRSNLDPMIWPATAAAKVTKKAYLGMTIAFLSIATKGIVACRAKNQCKENFTQCSRHMPQGILTRVAMAATAVSLVGSDCGRSSRAARVPAMALRIATMGAGHCIWPWGLVHSERRRRLLKKSGWGFGRRRPMVQSTASDSFSRFLLTILLLPDVLLLRLLLLLSKLWILLSLSPLLHWSCTGGVTADWEVKAIG